MLPYRASGIVLSFALLSALVGGCADQAEGERCDKRNGNADCASGLVCRDVDPHRAQAGAKKDAGASSSSVVGQAVCCPLAGASVDLCLTLGTSGSGTGGSTGAGGTPGSGGGTPADSGKPPDAATPDAARDARSGG